MTDEQRQMITNLRSAETDIRRLVSCLAYQRIR